MMPVTCIMCRGPVDGTGHKPACPILEEELAVYRLLSTPPPRLTNI